MKNYITRKYLVTFDFRDKLSTFVDASDTEDAKDLALKQLSDYVSNRGSITAVLKTQSLTHDIKVTKVPDISEEDLL
tara:strand:+ start:2409 stop:2639 length:231 start_codon:yes stop_codon:yes gene_type:complete